jgi:hypothetical protein
LVTEFVLLDYKPQQITITCNSFCLALVVPWIPLGPTGLTLLPGPTKWLGWLGSWTLNSNCLLWAGTWPAFELPFNCLTAFHCAVVLLLFCWIPSYCFSNSLLLFCFLYCWTLVLSRTTESLLIVPPWNVITDSLLQQPALYPFLQKRLFSFLRNVHSIILVFIQTRSQY